MSPSRKCAGRLFQTRGPAAAKLLSPKRKQTPFFDLLWIYCATHPQLVGPTSHARRHACCVDHKSDAVDDVVTSPTALCVAQATLPVTCNNISPVLQHVSMTDFMDKFAEFVC